MPFAFAASVFRVFMLFCFFFGLFGIQNWSFGRFCLDVLLELQLSFGFVDFWVASDAFVFLVCLA